MEKKYKRMERQTLLLHEEKMRLELQKCLNNANSNQEETIRREYAEKLKFETAYLTTKQLISSHQLHFPGEC